MFRNSLQRITDHQPYQIPNTFSPFRAFFFLVMWKIYRKSCREQFLQIFSSRLLSYSWYVELSWVYRRWELWFFRSEDTFLANKINRYFVIVYFLVFKICFVFNRSFLITELDKGTSVTITNYKIYVLSTNEGGNIRKVNGGQFYFSWALNFSKKIV